MEYGAEGRKGGDRGHNDRSGENGNTPLFNLGGSIQSLTVKCRFFADGP